MSSDLSQESNSYTHGALGALYLRTAVPIIVVMAMNGLLTVLDAVFLGLYVGPEALGAVTVMFPLYMLVSALTTLVSTGMASLLARHLGAGRGAEAAAVLAGAHGLALAVSAALILTFAVFGGPLTRLAAGGSQDLAAMGHRYLSILIWFTPVSFLLSVHADALRSEGRVALMAGASLLVTLANILFNWGLIAVAGLGVAGSAAGTVLAQLLALVLVVAIRSRGPGGMRPRAILRGPLCQGWRAILALGAPQSLGFLGIALGSAAILAALQMVDVAQYDLTVSAYGIVTRVLTFCYLPMLGLSMAMQSIVGNNYGAGLWHRSDGALRIAVAVAAIYGLAVETVLVGWPEAVGGIFVADPAVLAEVGRILPSMVALYLVSGPLMMLSGYFQSIGDAGRAAVLGLAKPYGFTLPLTLLLPLALGERGIWMAAPVAEGCLLLLAAGVLAATARVGSLRWGLFRQGAA